MRILTRAVDVAESQCDVRCPVEPCEGAEVALACELGGTVGGKRQARIVFTGRTLALPVDGATGRGEDNAGACLAGCLEDVDRTDDVDRRVPRRLRHGHANVGLSRQMDDRGRSGVAYDRVDRLSNVVHV